MASLAPILQRFFTDRMITQRHASQHTIAAYRDAFRLLLSYAQQATGTPPWKLELRQLDAELITGFLQHLQYQRRNSARTRNARLAAIHALYQYAALHAPEDAEVIQQVLAIDGSRTSTTLVTWLNAAESTALLAAAGGSGSWTGRRDHAMLLVLLRTGLRVSELTQLNRGDVHLGAGAHVRCLGKGRKERCTPLDGQAVTVLRDWLATTSGHDSDPLFPSRRRGRLTRDAVAARLARYHQIASQECPSLAAKAISPHTLRHSLPWSCGAPESTSPFSRSGSATPTSGQPRSMSTPTWRPRNAPSRSPARPASPPAAISHPTPCWPSSKVSDHHAVMPPSPVRARPCARASSAVSA